MNRVFLVLSFVFVHNGFAVFNSNHVPQSGYQQEEKQDDVASISADLSQYIQEQAFYEKLCAKYPEVSGAAVHVYYKKIKPIDSQPSGGADKWSFPVVSDSKKVILPGPDGTYNLENISFKITHSENFDPTQKVAVLVMRNDADDDIRWCSLEVEKKEPYLTRFEAYDDLTNDKFVKGAFWRQKLKLKATLQDASGKAYKINIESENGHNNPIAVRGMVVVYDKKSETTEMFFDFVDSTGTPVDHLDPIFTCKHKKSDIDKKVFRVHQHKLFQDSAKNVFGYFDSPKIRKQWMPDETGFYDLKKKRALTCLPSCYSAPGNHSETPLEPFVWVFGNDEEHDSFYELDGAEVLEDTNDYIYSAGDGSLSALLQYKTMAKEYLAEQNEILFHCLSRVIKPSLEIHKDVIIAGGHRSWPAGVYKRTRVNDEILWQRIEDLAPSEIKQVASEDPEQDGLNCGLIPSWSNAQEEITAQQGKRWCDAAQQFFHHFHAKIQHCDCGVLNGFHTALTGFNRWNKLTSLDVSNLRLDGNIPMSVFLRTIGSIERLTKLVFCNNNPINDFNENYEQLADRASTNFLDLGACLSKLKNLRELQLQGLWLKSHRALGKGVVEEDLFVAREVAILTGMINHKNRDGINAIIKSICALSHLETLSIDGIPSHGSSSMPREAGLASSVFSVCVFPAMIIEGHRQGVKLGKLAKESAARLIKIPSLRTIKVYSPGGNCVDYFSKTFKEELAKPRPDNAPELTIIPLTLG